jgi:hypothetical protein
LRERLRWLRRLRLLFVHRTLPHLLDGALSDHFDRCRSGWPGLLVPAMSVLSATVMAPTFLHCECPNLAHSGGSVGTRRKLTPRALLFYVTNTAAAAYAEAAPN